MEDIPQDPMFQTGHFADCTILIGEILQMKQFQRFAVKLHCVKNLPLKIYKKVKTVLKTIGLNKRSLLVT